ncbi:MAG: tetratricopeptide repeat protein [Acidobacteriota bacterium]
MTVQDDEFLAIQLQRMPPERFELLCRDLLEREGHEILEMFGPSGADRGVDILSRDGDGRVVATQCKRVKTLGAAAMRKEVVKVMENPPTPRPDLYLIAAATDVSRSVQDAVRDEIYRSSSSLGVASSWGLNNKILPLLRDSYPDIRERYLGSWPESSLFFRVPDRNVRFSGREEELERLERALAGNQDVAVTQTISGLGGIGKTQLAVEYCYLARNEYPDGVFWLNAASGLDLELDYVLLARQLLPSVPENATIDDAWPQLHRKLTSGRWLAVLDNADQPDEVRERLPPNATGHRIFTTRSRQLDVDESVTLELGVLEPEEAIRLLLSQGSRSDRVDLADVPEPVQELAEVLGYLPLALEQARAYVTKHKASWQEYLQKFERERLQLLEKGSVRKDRYELTVATTWEINFAQIQGSSPAAAEALEACAFLAPLEIPVDLFGSAGEEIGKHLGIAAQDYESDPLSFREEVITPLTEFSLLTFDTESNSLSIHRLVQEVQRKKLAAEKRAESVYFGVQRALAKLFTAEPDKPSTWPIASMLIPHVLAGLEQPFEDTSVAAMWFKTGSVARSIGQTSTARLLEERTVAVHAGLLGPEHLHTLASMNNLAETLRAQGDFPAAHALHEEVLETYRRVLGSEHPHTLTSMNNLALTLRAEGDLPAAHALHEEELAIVRRVLGPMHPDSLISIHNLLVTQ